MQPRDPFGVQLEFESAAGGKSATPPPDGDEAVVDVMTVVHGQADRTWEVKAEDAERQ